MNLWLPGGQGREKDRLGIWNWHVHTAIFKIDNQKGTMVQHREHCSILCNKLNGKKIWRRIETYACVTESLLYTRNEHNVNQPHSNIAWNFFKKKYII